VLGAEKNPPHGRAKEKRAAGQRGKKTRGIKIKEGKREKRFRPEPALGIARAHGDALKKKGKRPPRKECKKILPEREGSREERKGGSVADAQKASTDQKRSDCPGGEA